MYLRLAWNTIRASWLIFSQLRKIPIFLLSGIVYKFKCGSCKAT